MYCADFRKIISMDAYFEELQELEDFFEDLYARNKKFENCENPFKEQIKEAYKKSSEGYTHVIFNQHFDSSIVDFLKPVTPKQTREYCVKNGDEIVFRDEFIHEFYFLAALFPNSVYDNVFLMTVDDYIFKLKDEENLDLINNQRKIDAAEDNKKKGCLFVIYNKEVPDRPYFIKNVYLEELIDVIRNDATLKEWLKITAIECVIPHFKNELFLNL